jgi:hypothetical protein
MKAKHSNTGLQLFLSTAEHPAAVASPSWSKGLNPSIGQNDRVLEVKVVNRFLYSLDGLTSTEHRRVFSTRSCNP